MASGKQLNARKHSFRGLEHYIEENIRELHKMEVYIAVLEEQNKQLAKGINDPKKIANAYRRTEGWKKYQKEALERGAQDYRIVCNVSAKAAWTVAPSALQLHMRYVYARLIILGIKPSGYKQINFTNTTLTGQDQNATFWVVI